MEEGAPSFKRNSTANLVLDEQDNGRVAPHLEMQNTEAEAPVSVISQAPPLTRHQLKVKKREERLRKRDQESTKDLRGKGERVGMGADPTSLRNVFNHGEYNNGFFLYSIIQTKGMRSRLSETYFKFRGVARDETEAKIMARDMVLEDDGFNIYHGKLWDWFNFCPSDDHVIDAERHYIDPQLETMIGQKYEKDRKAERDVNERLTNARRQNQKKVNKEAREKGRTLNPNALHRREDTVNIADALLLAQDEARTQRLMEQ